MSDLQFIDISIDWVGSKPKPNAMPPQLKVFTAPSFDPDGRIAHDHTSAWQSAQGDDRMTGPRNPSPIPCVTWVFDTVG